MSGIRKLGSSATPLLFQSATCARAAVPKRVVSVPSSSRTRTFSILPSLRPTLQTSPLQTRTSTVFRTTTASAEGGVVVDVVPKTAITAHPAFAGLASQIRCGPRPTMANASRLIQKRRHGFLSRIRTAKGRKLLAARKAKGRRRLAA